MLLLVVPVAEELGHEAVFIEERVDELALPTRDLFGLLGELPPDCVILAVEQVEESSLTQRFVLSAANPRWPR